MKKLHSTTVIFQMILSVLLITGLTVLAEGVSTASSIPEVTPIQTEKTPEGLIIETIKEGSGDTALKGTKAKIHYTGWLASDGKKLDSSLDRDAPFEFPLGKGRVIKGWEMGVEGMKVGGVRRLTIPPDLAYGAKGQGSLVPPDATLIFDVELLSVEEIPVGPATPPDINPIKSWEKKGVLIDLIKEGSGEEIATNKKTCYIHYTGWLKETGEKFDSSVDRGKTFSFLMGFGKVIEGWEIGIDGMKKGEIRRLTIPPKRAYKDKGIKTRSGEGYLIPPEATLIFDVELVDLIGNK
jgi:peptidylprolyl isomerase